MEPDRDPVPLKGEWSSSSCQVPCYLVGGFIFPWGVGLAQKHLLDNWDGDQLGPFKIARAAAHLY